MATERYLRITNNFLHDMATGTWAACLLVLWIVSRRTQGAPAEAASVLADAMWAVFVLCVAALAVIAVTGGIRLRYWRREAAPDELAEKRRALLVKHVGFLLIYGAGTAWAYWLTSAAT